GGPARVRGRPPRRGRAGPGGPGRRRAHRPRGGDARARKPAPRARDHPHGARRGVAQRRRCGRNPAVRATKEARRMTHPAEIAEQALAAIRTAGTEDDLERIRLEYLGSRGRLQAPDFGTIPKEERAVVGQAYNASKRAIQEALELRAQELGATRLGDIADTEAIDVTSPGIP